MFRDIGPNDFARLHLLPGPDGRRGGPILLPGVAAGNPGRRLHTRCQGSTSSRSPRRRRRLHPPPGVAAHPSGAWVRNGAAPTTIRCHLLPVPDQGTAARILLPRAAVFVSRRREGPGAKDFRKSLQFSSKKIGPTEQPVSETTSRGVSERHVLRLLGQDDEPGHDLLRPRLLERDIELVALDPLDRAVAELLVEDPVAAGEG